jgi:hypothetical protein
VSIYFFHLIEGEDLLLDPEGTELADHAAVARAALCSARSIMSSEVSAGRLPLDMRIEVENGDGALIHRLPFADAIDITPPIAASLDRKLPSPHPLRK